MMLLVQSSKEIPAASGEQARLCVPVKATGLLVQSQNILESGIFLSP